MLPLGGAELFILLIIIVIVFGAGKLGQVGPALGKTVKDFRKSTRDEDEETKQDELARDAESKDKPA
jgi:sec-independent protein translocase protein TatA